MTLPITLIVFFSLAIIAILLVIAYFARKIYAISCDAWVFYDNVLDEVKQSKTKINEIYALGMLILDNRFAQKVESHIKKEVKEPSVKIRCDDGETREVPEDTGW